MAMSTGLLVSLCVILSYGILGASAGSSDVVTLTSKNFDEVIKKEELVLVKFYAPWCGHCKAMVKDFEQAATTLKGKAVLADVDATVEKELAEKYKVGGFPTLKVFSKGEIMQDYKGGRDAKSMVSFMERANEPPFVSLADEAAAKKFYADNKEKVVVFGVGLDEEAQGKLKKAIFSLEESVGAAAVYGAVKEASFVKSFLPSGTTVAAGDIFLMKDDDGTAVAVVFDKEGELASFVRSEAMPLFNLLSSSNAQMYVEAKIPLLVYFADGEKIDAQIEKTIATVAKKTKKETGGKVSFVWVNKELESFRKHVGLDGKNPAICVYDFETDSKFYYELDKVTEEGMTKFALDYVAGKLKAVKKSEPIPEKNDEAVKVVVGDSWDSIVMDKEKDVLVEMYAPWCGHCKKLEPIYNDLAEALKDTKTLVIAKMDATANDAPSEHRPSGFPTIKFFPAGNKEGMEYSGGRDKASFISFLKKHATHKVEYELSEEEVKEAEKSAKEEEGEEEEEDYDEGEEGADEEGADEEGEEEEEEEL